MESEIIQKSKAFWFFLLITVLLMLSFFLYNSIIVTWCIQKGVDHGWSDKQILGNISVTVQYFYLDQQSKKILQAF